MSAKKHFTLEEANALIPQLLVDIPKAKKLYFSLSNEFPDVKKAWKNVKYNGGSQQGAGYLNLALQLNQIVNDLESLGCVLKGFDKGLVDFPAKREGKEVYLCWKLPETEIKYWHDLDAGFAGRQHI